MKEDNTDELWDVQLDAILSLRLLISTRKGKKQVNSDKMYLLEFSLKRLKQVLINNECFYMKY